MSFMKLGRSRAMWGAWSVMLALASVVGGLQPVHAAPATPIDISAVKSKLSWFVDSDGNYYAVDTLLDKIAFFGDGKRMFHQRVVNASSGISASEWSIGMWDPLGELSQAVIGRGADRHLYLRCGNGIAPIALTEVARADSDKLADSAQFLPLPWNRVVILLARDDTGMYYLADRLENDDGSIDKRDYRVFTGKRGALKQIALTNVIDDTTGLVFSTSRGDLRLVQNAADAYWVHGRAKAKLMSVPLDAKNSILLFHELGVYRGIGTACEIR